MKGIHTQAWIISISLHLVVGVAVLWAFQNQPQTPPIQLDFQLNMQMGSAGQSLQNQAAKPRPKAAPTPKATPAPMAEEGLAPAPVEAAPQPEPEYTKAEATAETSQVADTQSQNQALDPGYEAQVRREYLKQNLNSIKSALQNHFTYPAIARRMGLVGKVLISFFLGMDGRILDLRIEKSSGHEILDQSALETIQKMASLPKPSQGVRITLPIQYDLVE